MAARLDALDGFMRLNFAKIASTKILLVDMRYLPNSSPS